MRPFGTLLKPVGSTCPLSCRDCYYRAAPRGWMTEATVDLAVREVLSAHPGPDVVFGWHGGEPLLRGLPFYQRAVGQQARFAAGRAVSNTFQTSGVGLTADWAAFFARAGFLVGLSLDGPAALHDRARPSSQAAAVQAWALLRRYQVNTNVLVVVGPHNVHAPAEVYDFVTGLGATVLQFIPAVPPADVDPEALGHFLVAVWNRWRDGDLGRVVVNNFEEVFRARLGLPATVCTQREVCGDQVVIDHDGSVYACDHAVTPEHRLGKLGDEPLSAMVESPVLHRLGLWKAQRPPACQRCRHLPACHGGCPLQRNTTGVHRHCAGLLAFYDAATAPPPRGPVRRRASCPRSRPG